jgi:diketogulonate reductase-like aldo/keto reductase
MLFVDMLAGAKIKPVTNQIEANPYFTQEKLILFTEKFGTTTTAYAPLGAGGWTGNNLLEDETLKEIAEKHDATPAQISLAWNIGRGVAVIPKSNKKERLHENFEALKITLSEEEIEKISKLNQNRRMFDPEKWDFENIGWKYTPVFI